MFADGISLAVQGGNGSSSIDLASGVLKLQASDFATIMTNNTLNLSSGTINISGSSAINIGTSASGAITIDSPNFSLTQNGNITAASGTIGDFSIGTHSLYASYFSANEEYREWIELNTSNTYIELQTTEVESMIYSKVRISPNEIYLYGADITLGGSGKTVWNWLIDLDNDVTALQRKTSKTTNYVTSQIVSGLNVYTHAVGIICFSHISGNSPTHAAGTVSSGYTAATGIGCAIPTGMTVFDENGKRIKFAIDSSGDISITKFIDAICTYR